MDDAQEPAGTAPRSLRHRWAAGVLVALAVLALIVFVPGPVFRVMHSNAAQKLVDEVASGRAELLAKQDEFRSPLEGLGEPVRSWSQVSCWLSPRYSDGDGEQDVVMFYWQQCSLDAYEVFALPPDAGDAAEVAFRLGGKTAGTPTCSEILFDVLTPDYGASRASEYAAALWWVDSQGEPPADQPDWCTVPSPGASNTTRVVRDLDGPMNADAYIVYQVRSPVTGVDVGCEHRLPWIFSCASEPEGFPVF